MADQLSESVALRSSVASAAGPLAALIASPTRSERVPAVLLVPGYTGSKEDFVPILDPLAAAGFVAVAIDQPGQYESAGPGDEDSYTPSALAPVLASVIRSLARDRRVILLGHSFGGLVSRAAVLAGAPVGGLILLCSGPAAFTAGSRFDTLTAGEPVLRSIGSAAYYDAGQRAAGVDLSGPDPLARFLRQRFVASNPAALLGMGHALLVEPDRTGELAATLAASNIPVAVIAGESDDAWPLDAQRAMANGLGTELVLVPGGAHSPAVEAPQELLAIMLPLLRSWNAAA